MNESVLAPVVEKADNITYWINLFPVNDAFGYSNAYSLDSDLPDG